MSNSSKTLIPTPPDVFQGKLVSGGELLCPDFFIKNLDNISTFKQDTSHDGKLTVKIEKSNLVIKRTSDGKIVRILNNNVSDDATKNLTGFYQPRFSLDDSNIYFLSDAYTTSTAIHELNLINGKTRFINTGFDIIVIPKGKYAGDLIAREHKYFAGSSSYDWYWIIDPRTGKEFDDPIGDNLWDFFDIWVCHG